MTFCWHHRDAVEWADVVIDADGRSTNSPRALPARLYCDQSSRALRLDDWQVLACTTPGGPPGGALSVLTITAPDGWTGAVVFDQFSGNRFAYDRLVRFVPYIGRLLSPRRTAPERVSKLRDLAIVGLPTLRAAMDNPLGWDPAGLTGEEFEGNEAGDLLTWSSAGVAAEDARGLTRYGIVPLSKRRGTDGDLFDWHPHATAHEVFLWCEAGHYNVKDALDMRARGFTAEQVLDWWRTPVPTYADRDRTTELMRAGWTPRGVRELCARIRNDTSGAWLTFHGMLERWTRDFTPATASLLLSAGFSYGEAAWARRGGVLPDDEALAMLASFRPEPAEWHLPTPRLGLPKTPVTETSH